jgi:hypothetical protein
MNKFVMVPDLCDDEECNERQEYIPKFDYFTNLKGDTIIVVQCSSCRSILITSTLAELIRRLNR